MKKDRGSWGRSLKSDGDVRGRLKKGGKRLGEKDSLGERESEE